MKIGAILGAYIVAALWSETDDDGEPLDSRYTVDDIAPATLARMRADCETFVGMAGDLLGEIPEWYGDAAHADGQPRETAIEAALGHDLWLTRRHHGVGFWDRGLGDLGDRLTTIAQSMGEPEIYVGDDGAVYQLGAER